MNTNGGIVPDSLFSYSPVLDVAYIIPGQKKSLGIKELDNDNLLLGGAFENDTRDMFIQLVQSDGSSIELKEFVHEGTDCST